MRADSKSAAWVSYLVENFDAGIALASFAAATILSTLGLLPDSAVPLTLLVIVGFFLTYQIRTGKNTWEATQKMQEEVERSQRLTQRAVDYIAKDSTGEIRLIEGEERLYGALLDCVSNPATSEILATYYSPTPPDTTNERVEKYWSMLLERARKDDFVIRRVVTVENAAKLSWLEDLLEASAGVKNLYIAILDHDNAHGDLLNLIVFDRHEVFLFGPHRHDGGVREYVGILNENSGAAFYDYFDAVWQRLATQNHILTGGGCVLNSGLLDELRTRFPNDAGK